MRFNDNGEPVGFTRLESLYPWPVADVAR